MKKVPQSEMTREALNRVLQQGGAGDPKSELVKLAVRSIVEETLEAVVSDVLGRGYFEHGGKDSRGHRNGYRTAHLKTGEGDIGYAVPQVRGVDNAPVQAVKQRLSGRTEALEDLAVEMYARGLSTPDIEDTFRDDDGHSMLSRTAVSKVTEALWEQYEDFSTRDLSEHQVLYLFLDGVAERLRPGNRREAVLCAWGLTWSGEKVLLNLTPGTKESTDCCMEFLQDMQRRGLNEPVLVATDGAPGLIRAVEECFPVALRQRCLAHKMCNLMGKVPEDIRAAFRDAARASYQAPSVALAEALRVDLVNRFETLCPTAVRCFQEDFTACISHLQCPPTHRRLIRTTNLLERLFLEERRRTKVCPTVFGERPVLKMMYAATIRASDRWHGITVKELERAQLERLQGQLQVRHKKATTPAPKRKSSTPRKKRSYSKNRT